MNQTEIQAAIASQEEYIRRMQACPERTPMGHKFAAYPGPREGQDGFRISRCTLCGVTETREDYDTLIRLQGESP